MAGSVCTLGARALSMSAIDTAKISCPRFLARLSSGAALIQQILSLVFKASVKSLSGSDRDSSSVIRGRSESGAYSCRFILGVS